MRIHISKLLWAVVLGVWIAVGSAAAGGSPEQAIDPTKPTIGIAHITFDPVFSYNGVEYLSFGPSYRARWRELAKENEFNLIQVEAGTGSGGLQYATERLVDMDVDAILLFQHDPGAAAAAVEYAHNAGVPVAIHGIRPADSVRAPYIGFDEYATCFKLGVETARLYKSRRPEREPNMLIVNSRTVQSDIAREEGFLDGFRSVLPEMRINNQLQDYGSAEGAMSVTETALIVDPDIDVIFATSDIRARAAQMVLRRFEWDSADRVLLASVGGGAAALRELTDRENAWGAEVGLAIRAVADTSYEVIAAMLSGELEPTSRQEFLVESPVFTVGTPKQEVNRYLQANHGIERFLRGVD